LPVVLAVDGEPPMLEVVVPVDILVHGVDVSVVVEVKNQEVILLQYHL
jgi:hypothetical protein